MQGGVSAVGNIVITDGGNNVITDYTAGDKISLGSDVVLKNACNKNSDTIINVDNVEFNGEVFVSGDSVSIPVTFVGEYNLDENAKNLDAKMRTSAIKLVGNEKDNSIIGSAKNDTIYGGAGADSLWGGKGNDTLYGGTGDDKFIYNSGDGKDTILDYESGDWLKISGGTFDKATFSKIITSAKKL